MSIQIGAHYLEKKPGGRGVVLGGVPVVPPSTILGLGGGVSGEHAAQMAIGLHADVTIFENSRSISAELDQIFESCVKTCYATESAIAATTGEADLVVGAGVIPGAAAPTLLTREMVWTMRPGAVLIGIAIDQGSRFVSSRRSKHDAPAFLEADVVHYCVGNLSGAVARTSTFALSKTTLPFVLSITKMGVERALNPIAIFAAA